MALHTLLYVNNRGLAEDFAEIKANFVSKHAPTMKQDLQTAIYPSPIGPLLLEADCQGLCRCSWADDTSQMQMPHLASVNDTTTAVIMADTKRQLDEYFAGSRSRFQLPLHITGTTFQKQVWQALAAIPYGTTRAYGEVARAIGRPTASRAVAGACHANPVAVIIPCHRVIGANGKLVGYAGGVTRKLYLIENERR